MSKPWQVYFTAVLGALGALIGWFVLGSIDTGPWNIWLAYPLLGAGLGSSIGAAIAAADGFFVKRSWKRGLRDALLGALSGALAGLCGLLVAEVAFLLLNGGLPGRVLGWFLLGLLIGAGDLLVTRSPRRALYGALGGALGGSLGGASYESLTQLFRSSSDNVQMLVGGLGLIILGACIGLFIPWARQILSQAELRVLRGEQAGLVREISDGASIGRYDGNDLYLPDNGVAWRHAALQRDHRGYRLQVLPEAEGSVLVRGVRLLPGDSLTLQNGDHIAIGDAELEFVGRPR